MRVNVNLFEVVVRNVKMRKYVFRNLPFMHHLQIRTKSFQQNKNFRINDYSDTKQEDKNHHRFNERLASDATIIADDLMSVAERRKQQNRKFLASQGEILYGLHPVYCALKNQRRKFFHLYVKEENFAKRNAFAKTELRSEIMHLASSLGVKTTATNSHALKVLSQGAVHQGVCLDASSYPLLECSGQDLDYTEAASHGKPPLWLLLSEIQDPMNVGAILRSAYYFGVEKIFMVSRSGCHLSPVVSKASSGALELLTVFLLHDLLYFLEKQKDCGWHIVATAPGSNQDKESNVINLKDFHIKQPTILILGNESKGVSPEVQPMCDYLVSIISEATHSFVDSLNVSVATGIMLHHLLCAGRN